MSTGRSTVLQFIVKLKNKDRQEQDEINDCDISDKNLNFSILTLKIKNQIIIVGIPFCVFKYYWIVKSKNRGAKNDAKIDTT